MLMKRTNLRLILAAAVLLAAGLACNMPGRNTTGEATEQIPVTTAAVETLQGNLEAAATEVASSQTVSIVVTEEQLTSLVAFELASMEQPPVSDPQVFLRNGQIEARGNVQQSGFSLPLTMIATVSVNAEGKLEYQLVDATIGPLPLPDSLKDQLTGQIDQAINSLTPQTEGLIFDDVVVGDGVMTITGHKTTG